MFLTTLQVELVSKDMWRLTAPLIFRSKYLDADITAPAGFQTDFASVPDWMPVAVWLFKNEGKEAAVIHDFLIVEHKIDRADADEVFLEAMKATRVPTWKRYAMHWAVSTYRVIGRKK